MDLMYDRNNKGICFNLPYFRTIVFLIGIGSRNQVLKSLPLSYHALILSYFWEILCNFTRVGYQYLFEMPIVWLSCEGAGLTSHSD